MLHFGIGAKFPITPRFGLRIDGRILAPTAIFASDSEGKETTVNGPDWEVLGSAYIALGGTPPPPPPARRRLRLRRPRRPRRPSIPIPTRTASRTRRQVPERARGQGRLPGRGRLPGSRQRRRRHPRRERQVPRRAGDQERLPGRRRLPRRGAGRGEEVHRRHRGHQLQDRLGGHPQGLVRDARPRREGAEGVPGREAGDQRPHRQPSARRTSTSELSQSAPTSVKEYFVAQGIDAERLTTVGYGMDRPIADNKTKAGKAKNRRTEFRLDPVARRVVDPPGTPGRREAPWRFVFPGPGFRSRGAHAKSIPRGAGAPLCRHRRCPGAAGGAPGRPRPRRGDPTARSRWPTSRTTASR